MRLPPLSFATAALLHVPTSLRATSTVSFRRYGMSASPPASAAQAAAARPVPAGAAGETSPPRPASPLSVSGLSTAATADTAEFGDGRDELADALSGIAGLSVAEDLIGGAVAEEATRKKRDAGGGMSGKVRIIYSDRFLDHRNPRGRHPECPERLQVIVAALKKEQKLEGVLEWVEPTPVDVGSERRNLVLKLVSEVHNFPDYLENLEKLSETGGFIDGDTFVSKGSYEIALLAVSAWIDAVDHALADDGCTSWALTRPPGHHATRVTGMGFCLLSNAAIANHYALQCHDRVKRTAIVDFDVHHGNGTEHCIREVPETRFVSSHESPLYPYTGRADFTGPLGNILNVELPAGTGIETYRDIYAEKMLAHAFKPADDGAETDLVIISAGFDALDVDPLASLEFKPEDYGELCRLLRDAAPSKCRCILGLEGGYNLDPDGISAAAVHTVQGFANA